MPSLKVLCSWGETKKEFDAWSDSTRIKEAMSDMSQGGAAVILQKMDKLVHFLPEELGEVYAKLDSEDKKNALTERIVTKTLEWIGLKNISKKNVWHYVKKTILPLSKVWAFGDSFAKLLELRYT